VNKLNNAMSALHPAAAKACRCSQIRKTGNCECTTQATGGCTKAKKMCAIQGLCSKERLHQYEQKIAAKTFTNSQ